MLRFALLITATLLATGALAQTPPPDLTLSTFIASGGTSSPIAVRNAADGSNRIFIVQRGGSVRVHKNGALLATPLVTISVPTSGERGLLGLAFHPDFNGVSERRFYLSYTSSNSGNPHAVAEFQTQMGNPDVADLTTRREVISVPDLASNHNGGDLHFGPDGYLYWSIGDGGPQGDPNGFAQCLWRKPADGNPATCSPGGGTNYYLLGKILRIDPTPTASATSEMCAATAGQPAGYSIPPNNPYVGSSNTCDEIAHFGMRNPWRMSFDRATGDLYVADVGQNAWEETTRIPAGQLGHNLGWRCLEGITNYANPPCTTVYEDGFETVPSNSLPFMTYSHSGGRCSISGGVRYRGPITGLTTTYISGDACTGEIFFSTFTGGSWTPAIGTVSVWTGNPISFGFYSLVGFGEDEAGNLYIPDLQTGAVYVFTSASGTRASGR
jgi:glucose/arabinose dehydrogenase